MTPQVGPDALFDALAHPHRRSALACLADRDDAVAVGDLAEAVQRIAAERPREHPSVDEVHLSLYHRHLPKLANAGLVEFDADGGRVRYPNHPGVDELLADHVTLDGVSAD